MELLVLNTKFESVALIDDYESLIWTDRYNAYGDFELFFAMDNRLLEHQVPDYYLWTKESEHCMIIEDLKIQSNTEDGNRLIVTGRSLESILDRRIVWGQRVIRGNFQNGIKTLLEENIINPSIAARKIENFIFEASDNEEITKLTVDVQLTGDNLYEVVRTLCEEHNLGFKITLNEDNFFVFKLFMGENRSYEQNKNPYVVFSPKFENIINSNYVYSLAGYKNVTLVAGEGEGAARKTNVVGTESGLQRREVFTDARDISSNVNGTTLSNAQYQNLLKSRGVKSLLEHDVHVEFEGEAEVTRLYKYGEDFFIGDIIQVANEYGHEGAAYISELVISQNREGHNVYPTLKTLHRDGGGEN